MKDVYYIASNSNGKDSLCMILELVKRKYPLDLVLFFDTGKEFKAIYEVWNKLKGYLDENKIPWAEIEPEYSFDYLFSEKPIKCRDGSTKNGYSWCGLNMCRYFTKIKTREIARYYDEYFPDCVIVEYIGIAADELDRVKVPDPKKRIIKKYPLIEWGLTENDCFVNAYKQGYTWREPDTDVELYQILDRVSCWCCGNKNLKECLNMYRYLPGYWEKLKEMQSKTDLPFKRYGSVFELEERFKKELEEKTEERNEEKE